MTNSSSTSSYFHSLKKLHQLGDCRFWFLIHLICLFVALESRGQESRGQDSPKINLSLKVLPKTLQIKQSIDLADTKANDKISFRLRSDAVPIKFEPAPVEIVDKSEGYRIYSFSRSVKFSFEYSIPIFAEQSVQAMFDDESNWYLNSSDIPKAYFAIDFINQTNIENLKIVTSNLKKEQASIAAAIGDFYVFNRTTKSKVELQIYLTGNEVELAHKLLDYLEKYLAHYEEILGAYPYSSFAVIENLAQTGFAFPTMTWLGSQLLRFPFIFTTSLPHELLHSWWGNGVFVDFKYGNWCEGLTTYMADYYFQPSDAAKRDYRLKQLLEYENYVKTGSEIPLKDFVSRGEDRSLQAIGYGKAMMVFHMLKNQIGDVRFLKTMRQFSTKFMGREASFKDIFDLASEVSGQDLSPFFNDWVLEKGALDLSIDKHVIEKNQTGAVLSSVLSTNSHLINGLVLPFLYKTSSSSEFVLGKSQIVDSRLEIQSRLPITSLWYDSEFDLFRKIKSAEKPMSISQVLGQSKITAISIGSEDFERHAILDLKNMSKYQVQEKNLEDINFDQRTDIFLVGTWQSLQGQTHPQIAKLASALKEQVVELPMLGRSSVSIQGQVFDISNRAFIFSTKIENSNVLGVISDNSLSGSRVFQRMLHYGAQSFTLLAPTGSVVQGLWQGQKSELYFEF